jgi:hypothetical protein
MDDKLTAISAQQRRQVRRRQRVERERASVRHRREAPVMGEHPDRQAAVGERGQHAAGEPGRRHRDQLVVGSRQRDQVRERVVRDPDDDIAPRREVVEGDTRDGDVEGRDVGRGEKERPVVAMDRSGRRVERRRLVGVPGGDGGGPRPCPRPKRVAEAGGAVGAQQRGEVRVGRRRERLDDDRRRISPS